jgi:hypothetical protein
VFGVLPSAGLGTLVHRHPYRTHAQRLATQRHGLVAQTQAHRLTKRLSELG